MPLWFLFCLFVCFFPCRNVLSEVKVSSGADSIGGGRTSPKQAVLVRGAPVLFQVLARHWESNGEQDRQRLCMVVMMGE